MLTPLPIEFSEYVSKMGNVFKSSDYSYDVNTGLTTINLCKTGYILQCLFIDINGVEFEVLDFEFNESITVSGQFVDPELVITVPPPKYFYGEVIATGTELSQEIDFRNKVPMIYLNTPVTEFYNTDYNLPELKRVEPRVFVLHEANIEDWLTVDHWDKVIKSLYFMADQLCNIIESDKLIDRLLTKNITGYAKIGDLLPSGDPRKNLFAENLSGVSINLSYNINSSEDCTCK